RGHGRHVRTMKAALAHDLPHRLQDPVALVLKLFLDPLGVAISHEMNLDSLFDQTERGFISCQAVLFEAARCLSYSKEDFASIGRFSRCEFAGEPRNIGGIATKRNRCLRWTAAGWLGSPSSG